MQSYLFFKIDDKTPSGSECYKKILLISVSILDSNEYLFCLQYLKIISE